MKLTDHPGFRSAVVECGLTAAQAMEVMSAVERALASSSSLYQRQGHLRSPQQQGAQFGSASFFFNAWEEQHNNLVEAAALRAPKPTEKTRAA